MRTRQKWDPSSKFSRKRVRPQITQMLLVGVLPGILVEPFPRTKLEFHQVCLKLVKTKDLHLVGETEKEKDPVSLTRILSVLMFLFHEPPVP